MAGSRGHSAIQCLGTGYLLSSADFPLSSMLRFSSWGVASTLAQQPREALFQYLLLGPVSGRIAFSWYQ